MGDLAEKVEELNKNVTKVSAAIKKTKEPVFKVLETPTIYAFTVDEINDVNNVYAVKVGDTSRWVQVRLDEWKNKYPTLKELAHIDAYIEIKNKTTGHTERLYFRDHLVHKWLEESGYIPLSHSKKKTTVELLKNEKIVNPFNKNEKLSQEFYVYNGNENGLNFENISNVNKGINEKTLLDFVAYIKKHPEFLKEHFSNKDIVQTVGYRDKKAVDYAPFDYQRDAVKKLVKMLTKKVASNSFNNGNNSDAKVLLNSGTGSGKSNMLMWATKALYLQEQNRNLSAKKLFKKVFSPAKNGTAGGKKTLTIATTAIPDVLLELQKTVESHVDFRSNWFYFSAQDVKNSNGECIEDAYNGRLKDFNGNILPPFDNVVVGISLQNVSGRKDDGELKEIHKILSKYEIDLVVGDEAHFAMFSGDVYKKAIKDNDKLSNEEKSELIKDAKIFDKNREFYTFSPRLGFLFASATIENLLISQVFNLEEDVVSVSQETIDHQAEIENEKYINDKNLREMDSPFFGKPVMNYFAINLNEDPGKIFATNDDGNFVNNAAEAILSILFTDQKIKDNDLENFVPRLLSSETLNKAGAGRHVLISFDNKKSADAAEKFLNSVENKIVEANGGKTVHIFNVSSLNSKNKFTKMRADKIKKFIHDNRFDTTITITVDRLNVGVSVDEWDTVILARGGNSISKRAQLYGRVSRTWNETIETVNEKGEIEKERYNLKPNSFIIDFNGAMVYEIENKKENLSDTNTVKTGGGRKNNPFKKVITVEKGTLKELETAEIRSQLEAVLKNRSIPNLVSRVSGWNFNYDNILDNFKMVKVSKGKVKLQLLEEKEHGVERNFKLPDQTGTFNGTEQDGKVLKNDDNENSAAEKQDKEEDILEKKKNFEELVNGLFFTIGILLNQQGFKIESFNELYEFLNSNVSVGKNFNVNSFKENVGLTKEIETVFDYIYKKDVIVREELTTSLKALLYQAETKENGFTAVLNELSKISSNEILTPIYPTNVPELIVSKINFEELKNSERDFNANPITILNNADKTGIFQIETFNKITEKLGKNVAEKTEFYSIPTSPLSYEIVKAVYVQKGWDLGWIVWDDGFELDCFKHNWAYAVNLAILYIEKDLQNKKDTAEKNKLLKNLDKIKGNETDIYSGNATENMLEFVKERFMKKAGKLRKFDVVVGNPPYQVETGGKNHQVYADFYFAAAAFSKQLSMIFPKGWQVSTGRASGSSLHPKIRADKKIISVDNYNEDKDSPVILFENVGTGGVNIVYRNENNDSDTVKLYEHGKLIDDSKDLTVVKYWNETTDEIFDKMTGWMESVGVSSTREIVSGWNPFGVLTYYLDPKREEWKSISEEPINNGIEVYGSKKGTSQYRFFHVDKAFKNTKGVGLKLKDAGKWKAMWMKSGAYANWRQAIVIPPQKITTDSFIGVWFDSEIEAKNFITYLQTFFYRFAISERASDHNAYSVVHEFVPDLSTITNPRTGKVGWDSDWTDEDLKTLFADVLTEEDWTYIEKTAIESDPAGARMKNKEKLA